VCIEVRTVPFYEDILNSTKYSYSYRGGWLGGGVARGHIIRMVPGFL